MTKRFAILLLVLVLWAWIASPAVASPEGPVKMLRVLKAFPKEEQGDKGAYFVSAMDLAFSKDKIFVCDNRDRMIKIFSLEGDYLSSFGRPGQGPGEFSGPTAVAVGGGHVFVADGATRGIRRFDESGVYKQTWDRESYLINLDFEGGKIMGSAIDMKDLSRGFFYLADPEGKIEKRLPGFAPGDGGTGPAVQNAIMVTVRAGSGVFHILQKYGPLLRTYDVAGKLIKEIKLERMPSDDKEYANLRALWGYVSFDLVGDRIYAVRVSKGGIDTDVFDLDGKFVETLRCALEKDETYLVFDIKVLNMAGKLRFYFLEVRPENRIVVCEY
jgi:hypothetical protein